MWLSEPPNSRLCSRVLQTIQTDQQKNLRKVPSKSANFATFLIFLCVTLFISVCDIAMTNNIGKVDRVCFSVPNSINLISNHYKREI